MAERSILQIINQAAKDGLTELDLHSSQVSELPREIGQLTSLTQLNLSGCPLVSPPLEIANRGMRAIRDYFDALEGESQILNEVKVLLVGEGAAGKTSLVKRILGEDFDEHESTTHGIEIKHWDIAIGRTLVGKRLCMPPTNSFFLSVVCTFWCSSGSSVITRIFRRGVACVDAHRVIPRFAR